MQDQRAQGALARIERALDRIERAAGTQAGAGEELTRLRAAHLQLRARVEGAISEIDRMLAEPDGAPR
jgi:multidrug resistance efflux pump